MTTKAFVGTVGGGVKALSVESFFDYLEQQGETNTPRDLFSRVAWLFRGIELRANAMGGMPYSVYEGDEEEFDWDEQYPRLHRLLRMIEADLCLSGAAYVLKKRIFPGSEREEIADLQRLNPWTVKVLTAPQSQQGLTEDVEGIYGFRQTVKDEVRWFEPGQMLYFDHLYNPSDDLGPGVAPAQVVGVPAELVANMNQYASAFFERGAIIPFVLKTESTVPESEQERLRGVFQRLYQGVSNFFKTPLLQRGLDIQQLGTSPDDLAMPELEDSAKKQVAAALGIPPGLLEQQDTSHATAKAHQLSFYTETVIPEASMIEERINDDLMDALGLELRFKPEELEIIQQQEAEKAVSVTNLLREVRQSAMTGLLRNWEARYYLDLGLQQMALPALTDIERPEDWQEWEEDEGSGPAPEALQPPTPEEQLRQQMSREASKKGSSPAGGPGPPAELWSELSKWRAKAEKRSDIVDFESEVIPKWLAVQVMEAQKAVGIEDAFLFLKQADSRATIERRLKRLLLQVLSEFEESALLSVMGSGTFDYDAFRRRLRAVLMPQMQTVATNQALQIASEVGIAFDPSLINTEAARWAREYTYELVEGLTDTTRNVLREAVSSFVETPEIDLKDLEKMLEPAFGSDRAEMIAVTETTRAYSEAEMVYQQELADEGLVMVRVWKTAADDRVCPICAPLDEAPEPEWIDQFPTGPPAHVNCRCGTALTSMPLSQLRQRYGERQETLQRELGEAWPGPEPGGGL